MGETDSPQANAALSDVVDRYRRLALSRTWTQRTGILVCSWSLAATIACLDKGGGMHPGWVLLLAVGWLALCYVRFQPQAVVQRTGTRLTRLTCGRCGYDLQGHPTTRRCTECGCSNLARRAEG